MTTKSALAIRLSKLKGFSSHGIASEQYPTEPEIAAEIVWNAFMRGDIQGKTILDLGCGTGILGIACLLLGARRAAFVDIDEKALETAAENLRTAGTSSYDIFCMDARKTELKADAVVMNPPFGTKTRHADREFLLKAFSSASVVYSIHKAATANFLARISSDNGFRITNAYPFDLPIRKTHAFHRRRIHRIKAVCLRFES